MTLHKLLLFGFLTIFTACKGQVKTKVTEDLIISEPGPTVIKNFKAVGMAPGFDTTLVSQYIRSIFQDSKGNMWFGTIGEGVVRYDKKNLTYFSASDGFKNNTVYAINEDKSGNIWLGTDQGVYKYDPSASVRLSSRRSLRAGETAFRNYNQKDGLSHLDITRKGILVDQSGTVWVGTHGGVFRYDPIADSKGEPSFSLFQALPPINVAGMLEDHSGNIWIASASQGVFRYDPSAHFGSAQHKSLRAGEKTMTHIVEKDALGDNYAGGIAEDKDGNMWFTMKNGICKYDPSASLRAGPSAEPRAGGKTFTEYTPKDGLGGTEFWGIYIEQSGIIWVTARGSTTRFDPSLPTSNPNAFKVFTPADGLNCCVQSMYQDREGNMWWGTGQGLYRFDGQSFYQVKKQGPW